MCTDVGLLQTAAAAASSSSSSFFTQSIPSFSFPLVFVC
jgi:hypothetical protein